jgi:hypothetical protein
MRIGEHGKGKLSIKVKNNSSETLKNFLFKLNNNWFGIDSLDQ